MSDAADLVADARPATCIHCGAVVPAALRNEIQPGPFCCAGCRAAWQLLNSCDLAEFYRLRDGEGLPAAEIGDGSFDTPAFAAAHVRQRPDGRAVVTWYVLGLHCPACVWLLERLPRLDPGISSSRIQFGLGRLTVVFDPTRTTPGTQARLAARLGYRLKPWRDQGNVTLEKRDLFLRFAVSGAAAIAAMHLSMNLYAGELAKDLGDGDARLFGWLAVAVATPAITWGAAPFWRGAMATMRQRRLGIDATAVLVIAVGLIASVFNLLRGSRELYVDAVAMFTALLLLGRVAVLAAREKVSAATGGLDHLLPAMARRADGVAVPTAALMAGEIVLVYSGEVLPCDGVVIDTAAVIDQAVLTGESRPITVSAGSAAFAGTTARSQEVRLSVTTTGSATRIGALIAELDAQADRPPRLTPLIDRLSAWFTPIMLLAAVAVALGWWWIGAPARGFDQAIALILVSCPCALGLAAPLTQAVTVARAARRGLLVRNPVALDVLGDGHLAHVVFDKTGTLTEGRMGVESWTWLTTDATEQQRVRSLVAAAEDRSQHPIALAISAHVAEAPRATLMDWREIPAQGVIASGPDGTIRIGNQALLAAFMSDRHAIPVTNDGAARSTIWIACDHRLVAQVVLTDPIRTGIHALLQDLRQRGISLHLASGDDPVVAASVGMTLGFAADHIHGGCAPADKAALVARLAATGPVAMIGDGLNDAPAMARADAAIGLTGGLESAIGTCHVFVARRDADVALMELFATARASLQRVRLILGVSLAYNAVGVALAAAGVWGPYLCALAMPASSLTAVVLATWRTNRRD